jgi:hypothetical protein
MAGPHIRSELLESTSFEKSGFRRLRLRVSTNDGGQLLCTGWVWDVLRCGLSMFNMNRMFTREGQLTGAGGRVSGEKMAGKAIQKLLTHLGNKASTNCDVNSTVYLIWLNEALHNSTLLDKHILALVQTEAAGWNVIFSRKLKKVSLFVSTTELPHYWQSPVPNFKKICGSDSGSCYKVHQVHIWYIKIFKCSKKLVQVGF